ncbi:MAG: DUF1735 domain-containing protein [Bacteroidales bacterium]|nr:DUF1735 domain-containing protein [Bacteroidales bacterium]
MKKIFRTASLLATVCFACSCYSDYIGDYDYPNMGFARPRQIRTVVSSTNTIYVGVSIAGKREVNVNDWAQFSFDESLLDGTPYRMLPESYYELSHPNLFLVRKSNLAVADVGITFTDDFYNDLDCIGNTYALPFRMVATSIPASPDSTGYVNPYGAIRSGAETAVVAIKYINQYSGTYYRLGKIYEVDENGVQAGEVTEYRKNNLSSNGTVVCTTKGRYDILRPGIGNMTSGGLLLSVGQEVEDGVWGVSATAPDSNTVIIDFSGKYRLNGDYRFYTGDSIAPQFELGYTVNVDGKSYRVEETLVLRQWAERELRVETF